MDDSLPKEDVLPSPAQEPPLESDGLPDSLSELEALARERLGEAAYQYAAGGSDDELTLAANRDAFRRIQIRCRRLVDVSRVNTRTELLGQELAHPIALAPVGFQGVFCDEAESATARGAAAAEALMIASSVSSHSIGEIAAAGGRPVWFQLYPTADRGITRELLQRAEAAGCPVVVLTVDTPCFGNRERHGDFLAQMLGGSARMGNFEGLRENEPILDPSMTWEMVDWLRANTSMKIALKGIVTGEDAQRSRESGVDAIIVSNHGGRQEESLCSTLECLPEVVQGVDAQMPVLIDGGFRRGTDIFKALAFGASTVCIGRPYLWGLAALGDAGVTLAVEILRSELVRCMQLAGTPTLAEIQSTFVRRC